MNWQHVVSLSLLGVLGGCGSPRTAPLPDPARSEYFSTVGEPYALKGEEPQYALTLALSKPVNGDKPWFALVDYENPSNPTAHLIAAEEVPAGQMQVAFRSPALPSLHNNAKYAVQVTAFADADLKHPITSHKAVFTVTVFDPIGALRLSEGHPRTMGHPVAN